jgi:hypothetical protein
MGLAYDPGPSASRTARRCTRRVAGRTAEACLTHNFVRVHSGTLAQATARCSGCGATLTQRRVPDRFELGAGDRFGFELRLRNDLLERHQRLDTERRVAGL